MENSTCKKICRFCLETSDSNFENIEEVTFANLDFLWLKVNLSISEQPVMCGNCAKTIKTSSDFKTKCLEIENCIMSSVKNKDSIKIDLRNVDVNKMPVENIGNVSEDHIVCRLCLEHAKSDLVILLRNHTDIVQKLEQNLPELDLSCTNDPVICTSCQVSLQCYFSFINTCLAAEEKIMEYCKVEGTNCMGQIDLNSIIYFTSKDSLKCKFEAEAVEIEEICSEVSENANNNVEVKKEEILDVELDIKGDSSAEELKLTDKNSQQQHMDESKIELHKCEASPFETKRKSTFRKHLLSHRNPSDVVTPGTVYKCDMCVYETKRISHLKGHMLIHKTHSEITMCKCNLCDHEAKRKSDLKRHLLTHKTHSEITMYKCEICDHKTKRKFDLKKHILTHNTNSETTTYKCYHCDYETIHKDYLQRHMLVHMDVPEIEMRKCKFCPFKTKWNGSFRNHLLIHRNAADAVTAGTICKCDLCDFETKWKANLKWHMLTHKTHAEITTYKCDLCSYEAKRKHHLTKHMLTHKTPSETTMYQCHQCKYETKRKPDLKRHVHTHKSHQEPIMYKCEA